MDPDNQEIILDLSHFLLEQRGPEHALAEIDLYLSGEKQPVDLLYRRVAYLELCGKHNEALLQLGDALFIDFEAHKKLLKHTKNFLNIFRN